MQTRVEATGVVVGEAGGTEAETPGVDGIAGEGTGLVIELKPWGDGDEEMVDRGEAVAEGETTVGSGRLASNFGTTMLGMANAAVMPAKITPTAMIACQIIDDRLRCRTGIGRLCARISRVAKWNPPRLASLAGVALSLLSDTPENT